MSHDGKGNSNGKGNSGATTADSTQSLTLFGMDPDSLKERAGIDFYPEPYCSLVDTALSVEVCFERNILELWGGGVGQVWSLTQFSSFFFFLTTPFSFIDPFILRRTCEAKPGVVLVSFLFRLSGIILRGFSPHEKCNRINYVSCHTWGGKGGSEKHLG